MYKKLLISFALFACLIFSFSMCFANNATDGLKDAANGVRNVVGGVENTVENAAKDISNASKNVTGAMENGASNVTSNVENAVTENRDTMATNNNGYNATRTSTNATFMGMGSSAWTLLILGIAALAIIALVWYYSMQMNRSNYNDRDE